VSLKATRDDHAYVVDAGPHPHGDTGRVFSVAGVLRKGDRPRQVLNEAIRVPYSVSWTALARVLKPYPDLARRHVEETGQLALHLGCREGCHCKGAVQ